MVEYNFKEIEKKWQAKWEKEKIFEVNEKSSKKKFYVLDMFPYPSGEGLHMGHAFVFSLNDIYARFKRMQDFNVLYPIGYDALGLPAENAAIKAGIHPKNYTDKSIANFMKQQKAMGWSYDWSRLVNTSDSNYYKWDQWIFLKMLEKGIAYRKKAPVNWCGKCESVLANEQVVDGKCWRHEDTDVVIKHLEQWFLRTTKYAEELLDKLDGLNWPERAKTIQKNWIGKSHGTEIDFEIPLDKKTNFILLHGHTANSNEDFHPWLKKELENLGYNVVVPNLPNTNNPIVLDQVNYILKNCKFDENTILLGHSLGSVVALKTLESLKKPIKKLILVSGFIEPNFNDEDERFSQETFDWKFDFNKIKHNVKEIFLLRPYNDSVIPVNQADKIQKVIGGKIINFNAEEDHACGKKEPEILNSILTKWKVFTTRPDTIYGVTFMVVSAQHPRLNELVTPEKKNEVDNFLKKIKSTSEKNLDDLEKEGAFTGSYAINPLTGDKIPVYAGNFVVADYGSGMVMAVPAHDQRDFEFAKKYGIKIKIVIEPQEHSLNGEKMARAYTGVGKLINSEKFNGEDNIKAIEEITKFLEDKKLGKKSVQFKLRDWLISRQRYWGTPIPIIYCEKCGIVPVSEKELPVKLPEKVEFGKGNPLLTNKDFVNVKCPKCSGKARRETDTLDTFANSSWYYLRYCDSKNDKKIFEQKKVNYWTPIDHYVGGPEHITMHLIYLRFYTKFLRDIGLLNFDEPALKYFTQGIIYGADGEKMSKSRGNIIEPMDTILKYGADTLRMFLFSIASPDKDMPWNDSAIESMHKFVKKFFEKSFEIKFGKSSKRMESKLNKAIKEISEDIENLKYNLAIIKIRQLFDVVEEEEISKDDYLKFVKMVSVFCPFIAEEIFEKLGKNEFVSLSLWPKVDEKKIDENLEKIEDAFEKTVADIFNIIKIIKEKNGREPSKVYIYVTPNEIGNYNSEKLGKRLNKEVFVFAVNDKKKYDPDGKAMKAKFGRPAVYVE